MLIYSDNFDDQAMPVYQIDDGFQRVKYITCRDGWECTSYGLNTNRSWKYIVFPESVDIAGKLSFSGVKVVMPAKRLKCKALDVNYSSGEIFGLPEYLEVSGRLSMLAGAVERYPQSIMNGWKVSHGILRRGEDQPEVMLERQEIVLGTEAAYVIAAARHTVIRRLPGAENVTANLDITVVNLLPNTPGESMHTLEIHGSYGRVTVNSWSQPGSSEKTLQRLTGSFGTDYFDVTYAPELLIDAELTQSPSIIRMGGSAAKQVMTAFRQRSR